MRLRNIRLALGAIAAVAASTSIACMVISDVPLSRGNELTAIVWDPAAKTEHFIRRAGFSEVKSSFVFLVPTPSKPEVALTPKESAFESLNWAVERLDMLIQANDPELNGFLTGGRVGEAADDIDVVSRRMVGDYDTAILRAESANALADWLKRNGFRTNPGTAEWLKPYVDSSFYLTAFKHVLTQRSAETRDGESVTLHDVRISFKTEKPFYPYREPKGTKADSDKTWRALFIAPYPAIPTHSDGSPCRPEPTVFAALRLRTDEVKGIASELGVPTLNASRTWYLSSAEEEGDAPRVDRDLTWKAKPLARGNSELAPLTRRGEVILLGETRWASKPPPVAALAAGAATLFLGIIGFAWWMRIRKR